MYLDDFTRKAREYIEANIYSYETVPYNRDETFAWNWVTGGASGGSCWGDTASHFTSNESEPAETDLDKFLSENFPDLTFFHYKKIIGKVNERSYTYSEYYGNYTAHIEKYITISELAHTLVELGYIPKDIDLQPNEKLLPG